MHPPPGPSLEESLKSNARLSREDIRSLQEWLRKQPHLPPVQDAETVPFLHRTHYSVERSKRLLDAFFTQRTHAPEVFADRDPLHPHTQRQLKHFHVALLRKREPRGFLVVCLGFEPRDVSSFDADRAANAVAALLEVVVMRHPMAPGFVFVLDARHFALGHLARASLRLLHTLLTFVQQAVPLPIKAIHVINIHAVVEKTMVLAKPLLGRELQRLLHFHSGAMEAFYEQVPKEILPLEYGGSDGQVADYHKALVEQLVAHRDWVLSLAARTVDESVRPGRQGRDVYGAAGSFKKLDID